MLMLSKISRDKKAVSIIIAYVLLITIAISLSAIVYNWLRFYVSPSEKENCPEGVSLIIREYDYDAISDKLNLTIQNKGKFSVKGFVVKVNDVEGSNIGIYLLDKIGAELKPGEVFNELYDTDSYELGSGEFEIIKNKLTFVEVQPFVEKSGNKLFCENIATQVLSS